jgi:hypothetical protein
METNEGDSPENSKYIIEIPNEIKILLGELPLLDDENPEDFLSFLRAVIDERKPQSPMDCMSVIDMTIKCWEELRLNRASAALIRGAMLNALIYFLQMIKPPKRLDLIGANRTLALKYFSKKPKEKEQVLALLAQHGITVAALQAKAAELSSEPLQMFERNTRKRKSDTAQEFKFQTNRQKGDPNPKPN